jgi:hypothetical protein
VTDIMQIEIRFGPEEVFPARPAELRVQIRSQAGVGVPLSDEARLIANRIAIAQLGEGCEAREVGVFLEYRRAGRSEWKVVAGETP